MAAIVLLVDDDRRLMSSYAEALDDEGLTSHCAYSVDDALAYLEAGHLPKVIVWDMMMPSGLAFAHEDTDGGMATGRFLYDRMREIHPDAVYILLTNDINVIEEYHKPAIYSFAFAKIEMTPGELCKFIRLVLTPVKASNE